MLVTIRDIEAALRREVTEDEANVLPEVIQLVEGEVETEIRRTLTVQERTETFLMDRAEDRIRLANSPVVAVSEVKVDGNVVDAETYRVWPWGLDFYAPFFGTVPLSVEVTYTGGLDVNGRVGMAALRSICAYRIARILGVNDAVAVAADPTIVESISVEGYSVSYRPEAAGRAWTEGEQRTLSAFRRPMVVT